MIKVVNNSDFRVAIVLKFNRHPILAPGQSVRFTLLELDRPNALFLSRHGIAVTQMFSPGTVEILPEAIVRCARKNSPEESEDYTFKDSAKRSEIRRSHNLTQHVLNRIKHVQGSFTLIEDVPWWPEPPNEDAYYAD